MKILLVLALMAAVCCWWAVGRIRRWAEARRLLDVPNQRSSHSSPTPTGGGLAIVSVTALLLPAAAFLTGSGLKAPAWFLAGGILVAAVSLMDDLHTLSSKTRFAAHLAAAAILVLTLGWQGALELPLIGSMDAGWLGIPLSLIWLAGLTNAYNFMDGIDGIAGGQGVVAGLGIGCLGAFSGQTWIAAAGLLLAGCCLGFLSHNWPPACIFMGDVGAAFLGFSFAALALVGSQGHPRFGAAAAATLFPFLFDSAFTLLRRLRRRENIFAAHRSHIYQRMTAAGWSHQRVSLLYSVSAALSAGAALCWYSGLPGSAFAFWAALGVLGGTLAALDRQLEKSG